MLERGKRLGNIKFKALDRATDWLQRFGHLLAAQLDQNGLTSVRQAMVPCGRSTASNSHQ